MSGAQGWKGGLPGITEVFRAAREDGGEEGPPQSQKQSDPEHEAPRNQRSNCCTKKNPTFAWAPPQGKPGGQNRPPTSDGCPRPPQPRGLRLAPLPRRRTESPRPPWLPKRLHSLAKIRPMPGLGFPPSPQDTQGSARRRRRLPWLPSGGRSPQRRRGSGRAGGDGGRAHGTAPPPANGRTAREAAPTPTRLSRRVTPCVIASAHGGWPPRERPGWGEVAPLRGGR